MVPLLIAAILATALIGLGAWIARRRRQQARAHARWSRLPVHYGAGTPDPEAPVHTLAFPRGGTVAVAADGLHFAYSWKGTPVAVTVPWNSVREVHGEPGDGLCVAISRVGDLMLPSRASHDVWEAMNVAHRAIARRGVVVRERTPEPTAEAPTADAPTG